MAKDLIQVVNLITMTVELPTESLADPGPRNVRGIEKLYTVNVGEALGKPRGFSRWYVGAISP